MKEGIGYKDGTKIILANKHSGGMKIQRGDVLVRCGNGTGMAAGTEGTTVLERIGAGVVTVPVL